MARPGLEGRNRAPSTATSQRLRAAPGLSVEAPLNVSVAPNGLQQIAQILGVGSDVVANEANIAKTKQLEEQRKETEEIDLAKAEADSWGDSVDPEKLKTSKVYAKRVSVLRGTRTGLELSEARDKAFKTWREENPLAPEADARKFITEWDQTNLQKEDGSGPIEALLDTRQAAIVKSQLGMDAYKLIAADREVYDKNVFSDGMQNASAAIMAVARKNGAVKAQDYQNIYTYMRSIGATPEQANKAVTEAAVALSDELESTDPLTLLPERWQDGAVAPRGDAGISRVLENQREVQEAAIKKKEYEAQEGLRFQALDAARRKVEQGQELSDDEAKHMLDIGLSPETVASLNASARSERQQIIEKAEREREKLMKHSNDMAEARANPYGKQAGEYEAVYGEEYNRALQAGDPQAARRVVAEAIKTRSALPSTYRNRMNDIPADVRGFEAWKGEMAFIRNADEQAYLSLSQGARTKFEAYQLLRTSAKYTHEQAFQRVQKVDPEAGKRLTGSKVGRDAMAKMVGGDLGYGYSKAREMLEAYGSLADMPTSEALSLAQAAFNQSYFRADGLVYHKQTLRSPEYVSWIKQTYAKERHLDADDLIVAHGRDPSVIVIRERNSAAPLVTTSADAINRVYRDSQARARAAKAAKAAPVAAAVTANLHPYRRIKGESAFQQSARAKAENDERARRGLPRLTPAYGQWQDKPSDK